MYDSRTQKRSPLRTFAAIAALLGVAAFARALRLDAVEGHRRAQRYEDTYYLPPPEWLPVLSLGYASALADLLWCRSLVYFGQELGQRGPVRHLFHYTDAILTLEPGFRAAYRWAATGIMFRPVAPTATDGRVGADYLRRAVKRWPNDGELRWDLGSYLKFQLSPLIEDRAEKERLQEEAAEHLHVAALKGAGPAWLALNNSSLLTKLGRTEQAIRQLEEVYATVDDDETREAIAQRLAQLRSEAYAEALKATTKQFEAQHAAAFPWLPPDLFFWVGEPRATSRLQGLGMGLIPSEAPTGAAEP